MAERRDGIDRRDEISDPITLGEVYRLLLAVDERTKAMQKDADDESHSLRKSLGVQEVKIALLEKDIENVRTESEREIAAVKAKQSEWRNWTAAVVVGAAVMLLQQLIQHGVFH